MTDQAVTSATPWHRRLMRPVPIGRAHYFAAPLWLIWAAMEIGAYRPPKPHWLYVGAWIVLILWAPVWTLTTKGRLIDLRLSPFWVLPLAAIWCVLIFACSQFIRWLMFSSLGIVVLLQLPLCLLPSRRFDTDDGDSGAATLGIVK
jgi:hypothetical protein